jgi:hypothetical protein
MRTSEEVYVARRWPEEKPAFGEAGVSRDVSTDQPVTWRG